MRPHPRALPLLVLSAALFQAACSRNEEVEIPPLTPAFDVARPEPYRSEDAELDAAMRAARDSFPVFLAESLNIESTGSAFMVQVHATTDQGVEDLWLSGVAAADGNRLTAVIETAPETLTHLQIGNEILFSPGQIVQWHYFKDDKVVGAQVTRIFRQRMTDAERADHDARYPFPFD